MGIIGEPAPFVPDWLEKPFVVQKTKYNALIDRSIEGTDTVVHKEMYKSYRWVVYVYNSKHRNFGSYRGYKIKKDAVKVMF